MTGTERWDYIWTYALVRNCCADHVNEIISEVGRAGSDSIEVRISEWCASATKTLTPTTMGKVFLMVVATQGNIQELCPEALEMLTPESARVEVPA